MGKYSRLEEHRSSLGFPVSAIFTVLILMLFLCAELFAKSVNSVQAEKMVTGWLKTDAKPLGMNLGQKFKKTEIFRDDDGQPVGRFGKTAIRCLMSF